MIRVGQNHGPRLLAGRRIRLERSRDFDRILRTGSRRSGPGFTLVAAANEIGRPRLGLIVPRAVGNAVARNRVKRAIRECFRLYPETFGGGRDFVIIVRAPFAEAPFNEICDQLRRAAGKIRQSRRERKEN